MKKPPSSTLGRSAILAKTGLGIFARELGGMALSKLKESRQSEHIKLLTGMMSQLKGSAMKLGQVLSLEAHDFLPPEAVEALSQLQRAATPVDTSVLFGVANADLGQEKLASLQLKPEPIASASIGQVYKGTLNDQKVAVKIQFPDMPQSIRSDMTLLRGFASVASLAFGKRIDFSEVIREVEFVLLKETDYTRELKLLKEYQFLLQHDPRFVVPNPVEEYSSPRVLTMSFEEGIDLKSWIATNPSVEEKRRVGTAILDLFIVEFFEHGFVQTDPNLANFLISPTGQIVLLDCGAVLTYPNKFVQQYRELIQVLIRSSEEEVIRYSEEQGYLDPRESLETKQTFVHMVRTSIEPFFDHHQPFDFSDKDYANKVRAAVWAFTKAGVYSKPPREFIFLHRKLGGVFHILRMMGLKIDLTSYWQKAFTV